MIQEFSLEFFHDGFSDNIEYFRIEDAQIESWEDADFIDELQDTIAGTLRSTSEYDGWDEIQIAVKDDDSEGFYDVLFVDGDALEFCRVEDGEVYGELVLE